jgi:hypothetical protein
LDRTFGHLMVDCVVAIEPDESVHVCSVKRCDPFFATSFGCIIIRVPRSNLTAQVRPRVIFVG